MNMKKISIIVPCHNCSDSIERTWKSIKDQSMDPASLECIFVDDASDDEGKTWQKLTEIEKEAPECVAIIRLESNLRQGGARNVALNYVSGEYLLFLDADDTLREQTCELLYDKAKEHDCDLIQFKHRHIKEREDLKGVPKTGEITGEETLYDLEENEETRKQFLTLSIGSAGCTNKFYKTALVKQTGSLYAENVIYEEPKFVYPMFLYAKRVLMLDEDLYEYHWREDSTMTSQLGKRLLDHPRVQLELLEDLMAREEEFKAYFSEIEYYFVKSFYVETLVFAWTNHGIIPEDFMSHMQTIVKSFFPGVQNNKYIRGDREFSEIVGSINRKFKDQEELLMYEKHVAELI